MLNCREIPTLRSMSATLTRMAAAKNQASLYCPFWPKKTNKAGSFGAFYNMLIMSVINAKSNTCSNFLRNILEYNKLLLILRVGSC